MSKKTLFIIGLIILAVILAVFYLYKPSLVANSKYDDFAEWLASKNITMYGAAWCSHCLDEKNAFEGSFKYVPYVECPDNPQLCLDKGIEGYPTWIFPDGKELVGEQGLEKLSQESGCPLPLE